MVATPASLDITQASYNDLASLQSLKGLGKTDKSAALQQMAKQFESLFVQQMLKSMRSANEVFSKGSYFDSNDTKFYRDMMDNQLSQHLVGGNGMGLADMFYQQMSKNYLAENQDEATLQNLKDTMMDLPKRQHFDLPLKGAEQAGNLEDEKIETPDDFIDKLGDMAKSAAEKLGVDVKGILAQAALETGWGKFINKTAEGGSSFNLFNIKADNRWQGDKVKVSTLEYTGDVAKKESAFFRTYKDFSESFNDYVDFLQNSPRYQNALQAVSDPVEFAKRLQESGYATDPNYATKISNVLNNPVFKKLR